jgi:photosystem II stability/assembly factor-like uncharacterized protein
MTFVNKRFGIFFATIIFSVMYFSYANAVETSGFNIEDCAGGGYGNNPEPVGKYMMSTVPVSTTATSIQFRSHPWLNWNVKKMYFEIHDEEGKNLLQPTETPTDAPNWDSIDWANPEIGDNSQVGFNSVMLDKGLVNKTYSFGNIPTESGIRLLPYDRQELFENLNFDSLPSGINYEPSLFKPNSKYLIKSAFYNYADVRAFPVDRICFRKKDFSAATDIVDLYQVNETNNSVTIKLKNFPTEVTSIQFAVLDTKPSDSDTIPEGNWQTINTIPVSREVIESITGLNPSSKYHLYLRFYKTEDTTNSLIRIKNSEIDPAVEDYAVNYKIRTSGTTLEDTMFCMGWGSCDDPLRQFSFLEFGIKETNNEGKIYVSKNSGVDWNEVGNDGNWTSVDLTENGSKIVASDQGGKIFLSSDFGATFKPTSTNKKWSSVAISGDGSKIFASDEDYRGNIFISSDAGQTWIPSNNNIFDYGAGSSFEKIVTNSNGTKIATVVNPIGVLTSEDFGETFTPKYFYPKEELSPEIEKHIYCAFDKKGRGYFRLAISKNGSTLVAAPRNNFIFISDNFGASWVVKEQIRNWSDLAVSDDGNIIIASDEGGDLVKFASPDSCDAVTDEIGWERFPSVGNLFISRNAGSTWEVVDSSLEKNGWTSVSMSGDGSVMAATNFDGKVYVSTDSGETWTAKLDNKKWTDVAVSKDGKVIAAVIYADNHFVGPGANENGFDFTSDSYRLFNSWPSNGYRFSSSARTINFSDGYSTPTYKPEMKFNYTNGRLSGISFNIKTKKDGEYVEGGLDPTKTYAFSFSVGKKIPNFIFTNAQVEDFEYEIGSGLNKIVTIIAKPVDELSLDSNPLCSDELSTASSELNGVIKGDLIIGSDDSPLKNVWIASNAVCRQLPSWNGSEIEVKVGGPHFRSIGTELNSGYFKAKISDYTLNAWGITQTQALNSGIQMLVDKSGMSSTTANISTTASSDGGVIITANDLTYSFPQLKIRKKITSSGGGSPGGGSNTSPTKSNISASGSQFVLPNPLKVKDSFFKSLNPSQISSISVSQFAKLPVKTIALLSPSQADALTFDQLKALKPSQVVALKPNVIAVLDSTQIAALQPADFRLMKITQISKISAAGAKGLAKADLNAFSQSQIRSLNSSAVKNLSSDVLKSLSVRKLSQFSPSQVKALTIGQKSLLNKAQRRALGLK